ncbi:MAG: right-handed parallel beta-helix repeat-containing protein, partial [Promethearchaeota archaeon]
MEKSKHIFYVFILIVLFFTNFAYFSQLFSLALSESSKTRYKSTGTVLRMNDPAIQIRNSSVTTDETWSGEILITKAISVDKGVTLTINPGTIIKFQNYRGYQQPHLFTSFEVTGTIKALGNSSDPIWFTSDGTSPINGDWGGITLTNSTGSIFNYTIVEYGILGIALFNSDTVIANSIVRWVNTEGYYAEYSKPFFINNTLYGCGYHEIALEQFNNATIKTNIFKNGTEAIHTENSNVTIEGNYFTNYSSEVMSFDALSNAIVKGNKFDTSLPYPYIRVSANSNASMVGNDNSSGTVPIPVFDYQDVKNFVLGYIPGDPLDQYLYVYDPIDETRRVVKKIGTGLSFGWAITYAMGFLWRFDFWQAPLGSMLDFIQLDPEIGTYIRIKNNYIENPRGLTFDGQFFYVYDHSSLKIHRFTISNNSIAINDTFDIPNKEEGGTGGLTTDGEFLYMPSRDGSLVRKLDKSGTKIEDIDHNYKDGVSSLVWTGTHFWALTHNGNITKFTGN